MNICQTQGDTQNEFEFSKLFNGFVEYLNAMQNLNIL